MMTKIGFQIISTTGEDENYKANELNKHGPTVSGWRSPFNCTFPQEIIMQLKMFAVLHQIQILAHQYLIPQKIEICTSDRLEEDESLGLFEYLGFVTFSDNEASRFRSRELKSIAIPSKKAKYVKLRIYSNHANAKNKHNQVGLMGINLLGEAIRTVDTGDAGVGAGLGLADACESRLISPYDDLAFEMYVDQETAKLIKLIESKKYQAICEKRFVYANDLNITLENLKMAGEILGRYEQEKKRAISMEDYDEAKEKKVLIESYRRKVYAGLKVESVLGSNDSVCDNHVSVSPPPVTVTRESTNPTGRRFHRNPRLDDSTEPCGEKSSRSKSRFGSEGSDRSTRGRGQTSPSRSPDAVYAGFLRIPDGIPFSTSSPQLHHPKRKPESATWKCIYDDEKNEQAFTTSDRVGSRFCSSESSSDEWSPFASFYPVLDRSCDRDLLAESPTPRHDGQLQCVQKEQTDRLNYSNSWSDFSASKRPFVDNETNTGIKYSVSEHRSFQKTEANADSKTTFDAYEDRMLPALKSYHFNEVVRECQSAFGQLRKTTLNEKEKKQALLPISIFGLEMIEKFYSKSFSDKEESLIELQQELRRICEANKNCRPFSFNKVARAATFLLHRGLRDKVFAVYRCAAETIRLFFKDFVPCGVSSPEVARSIEKLLPELLAKSGDVTPRIHNLAAHTLLSIAECEEVRRLNIIPKHLSRPLTSSVHPRLALSRLEMVEQLLLSLGISTDKKSGLTCRTLAEFGSSGLHHPAEAVRKVSERILVKVYKVNPRIVRKQLPPDDSVTRRNLLYRQLFQEFDAVDIQRNLDEQVANVSLSDSVSNKGSLSGLKVFKNGFDVKASNCDQTSSTRNGDIPNNASEFISKKSKVPAEYLGLRPSHKLPKIFPAKVAGESVTGQARSDVCTNSKNSKKSTKMKANVLSFSGLPKIVGTEEKNVAVVSLKRASVGESVASIRRMKPTDSCTTSAFNKTKKFGHSSASDPHPKKNSSTEKKKGVADYGLFSAASSIPVFTHGHSPSLSFQKKSEQKPKSKETKVCRVKKLERSIEMRDGSASNEGEKHSVEPCGASESAESREISAGSNPVEGPEGSPKLSLSMLASIKNFKSNESDPTDLSAKSKVCIFCLSSGPWTTEESLNNHYLNHCLMLTTCPHCKEVTEISELTNHLLVECKWKHLFRKCKACNEAILKDSYGSHNCTGEIHVVNDLGSKS